MAGGLAGDLVVGRMRDVAAGVADLGRDHAGDVLHVVLHGPEAAAGEDGGLRWRRRPAPRRRARRRPAREARCSWRCSSADSEAARAARSRSEACSQRRGDVPAGPLTARSCSRSYPPRARGEVLAVRAGPAPGRAHPARCGWTDAERDLAATLIEAGKTDEAVEALPALARPVVFQCGYGASGLPHLGTFGEVARPTMVRNAFRALTDDAIPTRLIVVLRRHGRPAQDPPTTCPTATCWTRTATSR